MRDGPGDQAEQSARRLVLHVVAEPRPLRHRLEAVRVDPFAERPLDLRVGEGDGRLERGDFADDALRDAPAPPLEHHGEPSSISGGPSTRAMCSSGGEIMTRLAGSRKKRKTSSRGRGSPDWPRKRAWPGFLLDLSFRETINQYRPGIQPSYSLTNPQFCGGCRALIGFFRM